MDYSELIARLRKPINWLSQGDGLWKDVVNKYDRTPYDAADALEAQGREIERLKQRCADEKGAADAYAMRLAEAERQRNVLMDYAETVAQGKRGDCTCWVCELAKQAQAAIDECGTPDSAEAVTCDHFPGQTVCGWCKGTGAIDAPTSADDPSCPECDGEGVGQ